MRDDDILEQAEVRCPDCGEEAYYHRGHYFWYCENEDCERGMINYEIDIDNINGTVELIKLKEEE